MRVSTNRVLRAVAIVGVLAMVPLLAACAKSSPVASSAQPTASAASSDAPTTGEMTLKLLAPTEGAEVAAGTVTVKVETTGLKFTMPSNNNAAGEGHVHFTLDDRPFEMSVEPQIDFKNVTAGTHKLKAELVQNDTKSFDPPIEEEIEFVAK